MSYYSFKKKISCFTDYLILKVAKLDNKVLHLSAADDTSTISTPDSFILSPSVAQSQK